MVIHVAWTNALEPVENKGYIHDQGRKPLTRIKYMQGENGRSESRTGVRRSNRKYAGRGRKLFEDARNMVINQ